MSFCVPHVLIVTNRLDLTADLVVLELAKQGVPFFRLNTELLHAECDATIFVNGSTPIVQCRSHGIMVDLRKVRSVWYRRPQVSEVPSEVADPGVREFISRERQSFLGMLWASLDAFWISNPVAIRAAENKLRQLVVAGQVGLHVPKTTITGDAAVAASFLQSCQNETGVVKPLSRGDVTVDGEDCVIYASEVDHSRLTSVSSHDFRLSPVILQELVRGLNLRVVVMGSSVTAVEIRSADNKTPLDWRRSVIAGLTHESHDLPGVVAEQCMRIVRQFGLMFSSMDLIRTETGDYYFLDLNPNGQWAWLDTELDIGLTKRLCTMLARGQDE